MAKQIYVPFAMLLIAVLLSFLFVSGNTKAQTYNSERFYSDSSMPQQQQFPVASPADHSVAALAASNPVIAQSGIGNFNASDPSGDEAYNPVIAPASNLGNGGVGASAACFPRDRLTATDLLPKDAANSRWAQLNPAGQGDVRDQNFLTAGYHVGVNTTGSTKKNSNLQLRSEPANPQLNVSPWNQSTIEPSDAGTGRRPLEIGGDY
jgi:hypothetical protein